LFVNLLFIQKIPLSEGPSTGEVLDVLPRPSDDDNPIGGISMVRSFCTLLLLLSQAWWLVVVVVVQCFANLPGACLDGDGWMDGWNTPSFAFPMASQ
jgi:hypothetical protein